MAEFKNLHLLTDIDAGDIDKMEAAALLHRRHSGITFKIVDYEPKKVTIQVVQGKSTAENYFPAKRLIEIVHETFDRFFTGKKVMVHPVPYVQNPVSNVDAAWINKKMLENNVKLKDIVADTGLNKTQLSAIINDKKPLSQVTKALFYFYFLNRPK